MRRKTIPRPADFTRVVAFLTSVLEKGRQNESRGYSSQTTQNTLPVSKAFGPCMSILNTWPYSYYTTISSIVPSQVTRCTPRLEVWAWPTTDEAKHASSTTVSIRRGSVCLGLHGRGYEKPGLGFLDLTWKNGEVKNKCEGTILYKYGLVYEHL